MSGKVNDDSVNTPHTLRTDDTITETKYNPNKFITLLIGNNYHLVVIICLKEKLFRSLEQFLFVLGHAAEYSGLSLSLSL